MYNVSTQLYLDLADKLFEQIASKEFFSGAISLDFGAVECRLVATLIVERQMRPDVEFSFPRITNLVPIWWEFHTTIDGGEVLNDFSFRDLVAEVF